MVTTYKLFLISTVSSISHPIGEPPNEAYGSHGSHKACNALKTAPIKRSYRS